MVLRRGREAAGSSLLPGYKQLTEIGGGAFATVFRAVEAETGRAVALKILKVDTIHAHLIETFHHEIQALAKVSDHPNIVTLYRPSTTTDGRPVLVLELCRESLAQQLRGGGPLTPVDVTRIGVKIAGALETAHRNGFLHRDMKPQNILVTQFGEPALADFGVAALQASAQVTAGVFGFTTLHAAPEMLEGHHLSPATDIYGLASTMYQLLTGQAPFATFDNEAPASVILRILRDPVRPLRSDHIPLALADLLEAALSKNPEGRPRSALDFAAALQSVEAAQGWPVTNYVAWGDEGAPAGPAVVANHLRPSPDAPWPVPGVDAMAAGGYPGPAGGRAGAGVAGAGFAGPVGAGTGAAGHHGRPADGPAPGAAGPGGPGSASPVPAPAGGAGIPGRESPLYPTAPGVRVEAVEPLAGRSSLPPLLPPSVPSAPSEPAPAFPDPPPPAAAPRRPSIEVPEPATRNVVAPDSGRRGQPSRPLEPPAAPLAPLGSESSRPAAPLTPIPPTMPPAPAPPFMPPAPAPSAAVPPTPSMPPMPGPPPGPPPAMPPMPGPPPGPPPAMPPMPGPPPGPPPAPPFARPSFVDPARTVRRDGEAGAESVYERTTDVGALMGRNRPPAPVPAPTASEPRTVAGLPVLVAVGIGVAALVVLAAVLLLLGVV